MTDETMQIAHRTCSGTAGHDRSIAEHVLQSRNVSLNLRTRLESTRYDGLTTGHALQSENMAESQKVLSSHVWAWAGLYVGLLVCLWIFLSVCVLDRVSVRLSAWPLVCFSVLPLVVHFSVWLLACLVALASVVRSALKLMLIASGMRGSWPWQ